jgi:hypothetical protein
MPSAGAWRNVLQVPEAANQQARQQYHQAAASPPRARHERFVRALPFPFRLHRPWRRHKIDAAGLGRESSNDRDDEP